MASEGEIEVIGLPHAGPSGVTKVTPKSLTAKFLCKNHNSELASVDTEGTRWITEIFDGFNAVRDETLQADRVVQIDGNLVERWIFKIACGMIASGNARLDFGRVLKTVPPLEALKVLFGDREFDGDLGLYVRPFGRIEDTTRINFSLAKTYLQLEGNLIRLTGVDVGHSGLSSFLKLDSDFEPTGGIDPSKSIFRPAYLEFHKKAYDKKVRIEIRWKSRESGKAIRMQVLPKGTKDRLGNHQPTNFARLMVDGSLDGILRCFLGEDSRFRGQASRSESHDGAGRNLPHRLDSCSSDRLRRGRPR